MPVQAHAVKHASAYDAMQDVGLGAVAMDARCIGAAHAYVVQHRGLLNKLDIDRDALINESLAQLHGQVCHLTAMRNQHPVIIITGCVVSLDNG